MPKKEEIAFVNNDKSYISEQPKTAVPEKPKAVEQPKLVIEKKLEPPKPIHTHKAIKGRYQSRAGTLTF